MSTYTVPLIAVERETGFEPATFSLARRASSFGGLRLRFGMFV